MNNQKRILICDDHYDFFETLSFYINEYIQGEDVNVEFSSNGSDALQNTSKYKYDLIISDFKMPGMNGVEFINKLREDKETLNVETPVLMFSAYRPDLTELNDGENSITFMSKPFNSDKLMEYILNQFEKK